MSNDYEERAQDAGVLRWRFERVLRNLGNEIGDQLGQGGSQGLAGLRALIASLPTVMSFFAEGHLWEEAGIDAILLSWIADQRRPFAGDVEAETILDGVRALAAAAIAGRPLLDLDLACKHLLGSIHDR